jgi:two-component system sensor histidine kinase YesM
MKPILKQVKIKFILLMLAVVVFSLAISSYAIYVYINNILSKQLLKDNSALVNKMNEQLAYTMEDIRSYCMNIITDDQVQFHMRKTADLHGYEYFSNISQLEDILLYYTFLREGSIISIYAIDKRGEVLTIDGLNMDLTDEEWYRRYLDDRSTKSFSDAHEIYSRVSFKDKVKVISYIQNVYDKNKIGAYLGKIVINLDYDELIRPFMKHNASIKQFLIINSDGNIIFDSGADESADYNKVNKIISNEELTDILYDKQEDNYYIIQKVMPSDWTIIGVLPSHSISKSLTYIRNAFIIVFASCFIIISLIVFPLIKSITRPVMTLINGMKEVSAGKLDTEISIQSGDEIEEASHVFNKMVKDIRRYIDELVEKEKYEREMKLKIFMAQINPHFIYNTLNTIIYLARKISAEEIISVTRDFIRILQNTIKTQPDELTTVQNEIDYINSYVSILKYRYNDQVELVWDVEEGLKERKILRMLLYPLVENSVFHGILPKSSKGTVKVSIKTKENKMEIVVQDDGVGIEDAVLQRLRASLSEANGRIPLDHKHIGLSNVSYRLRLLYGQEYKLNIESHHGYGTKAWFYLPLLNNDL